MAHRSTQTSRVAKRGDLFSLPVYLDIIPWLNTEHVLQIYQQQLKVLMCV